MNAKEKKLGNNGQDTAKETPATRIPQSDPFANLDRLRVSQDFTATAGVKKVLTVVKCGKPNRHEFVRVRPGDDARIETPIFEDKANGNESYMVSPDLLKSLPELASDCFVACLLTAITRQGDLFLWQVKLPGSDGRSNAWHESALQASQLAERHWIRMSANMPAGMYDTYQAAGELTDPEWPDYTLQELLRLCFKSRFISSPDHPILKSLRGEV
jgi:hypothetical protein